MNCHKKNVLFFFNKKNVCFKVVAKKKKIVC